VKRNVIWLMSTVSSVVLLFGYHTSTSSQAAGGGTVVATPATGGSSGSGSGSSQGSSGSGSSGSSSSGTVTGSVASTRWGDVQVAITVSGGRITDVTVPEYPNGNGRDQEINAYALPVLVKETLSAQSADIDMVSGATVTSTGYVQSLQSALDEAGL
jgi:uncharacterized protein with FMN-binding domain